MFTEADYAAAAARLGVSVAAVKAVAVVESSGQTFWEIDGKCLPPVRFEAHWFSKLTSGRFDESHPDLSSPSWNPSLAASTWRGAWDQLSRARALDHDAADQATSWGAFQVMGFNWQRLRYNAVAGFVSAMDSAAGQLDAFARFIEADSALQADLGIGAWLDFERRYNGGGYNGAYAAKIKAAYSHFAGVPTAIPRLLKLGDAGADVGALCDALGVEHSEIFDEGLDAVVRGFQRDHQLTVDGVVGPMTRRALGL
jgi:peptidoglycan hydrolase-like protein with peptidoglycan-binding domain